MKKLIHNKLLQKQKFYIFRANIYPYIYIYNQTKTYREKKWWRPSRAFMLDNVWCTSTKHVDRLTHLLNVMFSDRGPAGKTAARWGRPRAAQSRSDARTGGPGASGESSQRATRTTLAQKPHKERHRGNTPHRQRLQKLIVSDSWLHPIRINTALIDSTYRPITLTSERVTLPHLLLASTKLTQTGAILELPLRGFRLWEHWNASNFQQEITRKRRFGKGKSQ